MGDSSWVSKASLIIDLIGELDELNSHLGVLVADNLPEEYITLIRGIQHDLFDAGGELTMQSISLLPESRIEYLEAAIDRLNEELSPLKEFILPGGSKPAATCHVARAVCRRAERSAVSVSELGIYSISSVVLRYLNRLSDLLFVLSRHLNKHASFSDIFWNHDRK